MARYAIVAFCLASLLFCAWAASRFHAAFTRQLEPFTSCSDRLGHHDPGSELFARCIDAQAKLFIERDVAETKDLGKAFLTLLVGVFVASITFSEKIVNVDRATVWSRGAVIACWVLILLAIASCGVALALMIVASGFASYEPYLNYYVHEGDAMSLLLFAGVVFGTALVALFVAGVLALVQRRKDTPVGRMGKFYATE